MSKRKRILGDRSGYQRSNLSFLFFLSRHDRESVYGSKTTMEVPQILLSLRSCQLMHSYLNDLTSLYFSHKNVLSPSLLPTVEQMDRRYGW